MAYIKRGITQSYNENYVSHQNQNRKHLRRLKIYGRMFRLGWLG